MQVVIALIIMAFGISNPESIENIGDSALETVGQLPEILVTAPRSQYEDIAWSGLLDTIETTASHNTEYVAKPVPMIGNIKIQTPWQVSLLFLVSGFASLGFYILYVLSHNGHKSVKQACKTNEQCIECKITV